MSYSPNHLIIKATKTPDSVEAIKVIKKSYIVMILKNNYSLSRLPTYSIQKIKISQSLKR